MIIGYLSVKKLFPLKHSEHSSPQSFTPLFGYPQLKKKKITELFKNDFKDINKHVTYFEQMLWQATILANKFLQKSLKKVLSISTFYLNTKYLLMLSNSTEAEIVHKLMPNTLLSNRISYTCDVFKKISAWRCHKKKTTDQFHWWT